MNGEIQRFLNDVDSKIFRRGLDYYRSGMVECIDWDGSHATAEVSGSEEDPYLVEIDFSDDGEVEDWFCDCPYDWGPVCKHVVAALLALQESLTGEAYSDWWPFMLAVFISKSAHDLTLYRYYRRKYDLILGLIGLIPPILTVFMIVKGEF